MAFDEAHSLTGIGVFDPCLACLPLSLGLLAGLGSGRPEQQAADINDVSIKRTYIIHLSINHPGRIHPHDYCNWTVWAKWMVRSCSSGIERTNNQSIDWWGAQSSKARPGYKVQGRGTPVEPLNLLEESFWKCP